ncbi:DUF2922 domain-containing protein [Lysinibacillus endophyticus]|uniref:DUF2922 domain-containing protein n=1 Tax=Ureibacillus endophyticus TaxID=1978490 RepID=A0A494YWP9_9BACL|nr:DUF2922 domain-containing protein [Lysinibacillus endophyticus]RKQ14453.1 DUF2922 domain-containing protein [Lysinibacillus endophyticus]
MTQVLELKFDTDNGKQVTLSINNPKSNLTPAEIATAMTTVINQNVFHKDGHALTAINQARMVARTITEFDLV